MIQRPTRGRPGALLHCGGVLAVGFSGGGTWGAGRPRDPKTSWWSHEKKKKKTIFYCGLWRRRRRFPSLSRGICGTLFKGWMVSCRALLICIKRIIYILINFFLGVSPGATRENRSWPTVLFLLFGGLLASRLVFVLAGLARPRFGPFPFIVYASHRDDRQ